jgi:cyclopropane-fatty-acyl-phospholipid synthase
MQKTINIENVSKNGVNMFQTIIEKKMLKQLQSIRYGTIKLTTPANITHYFRGDKPGYDADINIEDWKVAVDFSQRGDVALAEDYRDGLWHTNDLSALLTFGLQNEKVIDNRGNWLFRQISKLKYLFRANTVKGSRKNIQAHYDLGNEFYKLWLDASMTYSSGLFIDQNESLYKAQLNKYDRILSMLPDQKGRMLEIGCGWGGFAERALTCGSYNYRGITLSTQQHAYAQKRLNNQCDFVIEDYRSQQGKFDYIISIEMLEAVGEKYWHTYFDKIKSLLSHNGRAVIQSITVADELFAVYRQSADMIRTFIFPGGMLPCLSKLTQVCHSVGLKIHSQYAFGQSYAQTLRHWLNNFETNISRIRALGYDDAFIRLWRFYLAGCIATFVTNRTNVFQLEITHA